MVEVYAIQVNKYNVVEVLNSIGAHYRVVKFWYNNEIVDFYRAISLLITNGRILGEYNSTTQEMELFWFE